MKSRKLDIAVRQRTDLINYREIRSYFRERLHQCVQPLYAPLIESGAIRPDEVEEETNEFFIRKSPVLQTLYSYNSEQWSQFYDVQEYTDANFWHFLTQSAYRLSKEYTLTQLNVEYYLTQFQLITVGTEDWKRLRNLFFDKWEKLLIDREYSYGLDKVNELCNEYHRYAIDKVSGTTANSKQEEGFADRLAWIKNRLNSEARKRIEALIPIIRRNPIVKEIIRELGREDHSRKKGYKGIEGLDTIPTIRRAHKSDIVGITEGNNLGSLLPIEYCYMSDKMLEPVFMQRMQDKRLQVFDYTSQESRQISPTRQAGSDSFLPEKQGPFVVCVDTSSSMSGTPEEIEKAIVLAAALMAETKKRKCVVVLFAETIETIEIADMYHDITLLQDFLLQTFQGGTDLTSAIQYAAKILTSTEYSTADLLLMSDFDLADMNLRIKRNLEDISDRRCKIYSLAFGHDGNEQYLEMSHKVWCYN